MPYAASFSRNQMLNRLSDILISKRNQANPEKVDFSIESYFYMTIWNPTLLAFVLFLLHYVQALRSLQFLQKIGAKPSINLGL